MKVFNLKKSIWNDYILMVTLIAPIILIGFLIVFFINNEDNKLVIYIFTSFIPIFSVIFLLRIKYIKSFLNNSNTIQGVILDVWFFRDRGRIEYVFEIENNRFSNGQAIMKNKFTKKLNKGQVIELLIKKNGNIRTLIQDLYFDSLEKLDQN